MRISGCRGDHHSCVLSNFDDNAKYCHSLWDVVLCYIYSVGWGIVEAFQKHPLGFFRYNSSYPTSQEPDTELCHLSCMSIQIIFEYKEMITGWVSDPVNPRWERPGSWPHATFLDCKGGYSGALGTWESKSTHTLGPTIPVSFHFPTEWLPE